MSFRKEVIVTKGTKDFTREVVVLGLPIAFQTLINNLVSVFDNLMIGSLGELAMSAVSVCTTFLWLTSTFTMSISGGASIIAAQDYGKGNLDKIKKMLSIMLVLTLIIALFFFIVIAVFPTQIIQIYSNIEGIVEPGSEYFKYLKYSLFFNMTTMTIITLLRSVRDVKLGLINSLLSCVFKVFFNWVFIFGNLGAPAMGIAGAALGTLLTRIVEFLIVFTYLIFFEKNLKYRLKDFSLDLDIESIKLWYKITMPLLIIEVLGNMSSSVQTMITGRISDNYLSANSIVHNAWMLPNVFLSGVAMAASIMVGNSLGKGDYVKVKEDSKRFVAASIIFGCFSATMVQVILPILSGFYNITEATKVLATQMGYSASVSVFFLGMSSIICRGVIRAGGLTKQLLKIDILSTWFVAIPLGIVCAFVLKLPAAVIYLVLRSGNIFKTIWGLIQLKSDEWMVNLEHN